MLSKEVLLLLGQISQVLGWCSCKDLVRWNDSSIRNNCSSSHDSEAFNNAALSNTGSHADVGEALELALFKLGVGSHKDVFADDDSCA